ncbi:hypothetical protein BMOU_1864 [Bifidobacterium moukalabense DSM 27321]|uniref:Uncharacterized protein n=3 Tax=Bifidobacterium moukalabense TaxID=1333651 RepID=W4N945_9BIFI|nr:hypothetical protein BMOU_1864 [Bifidobacterium moukalabense DSM 27321]
MRQPMFYADRGQGWENLTGHAGSPAALSSFSVEWGTDSPKEQPSVNVLHFRLLDRTGMLAGNSTRLAGMKVLVQLSRRPLWRDLNATESWDGVSDTLTWDGLHLAHRPDQTEGPDPTALTIFTGNTTTGGTITQNPDGTYLLDLYANAQLVRAGRTTRQGPVSTDARLTGLHWTGTAAQRVDEINRRLTTLGCPPLSDEAVAWLKANAPTPAPYEADSHPDLSTILYALAATHPDLPLFYERHRHGSESVDLVFAGRPAAITMHADGRLTVEGAGLEQEAAPADAITVDDNMLTMPAPVSRITLRTRAVKWDESGNRFSFEDDEVTIGDRGRLPAELTETINAVPFSSDAITRDDSAGHWQAGTWTPTDAQRDQWAEWLAVQTLRLRPKGLTASSRRLDIDLFEQALQPTASLWAFVSTRYTRLLADDGTPATSGAWLATGGTLSFDWRDGIPVLENELDISPLPMLPSTLSRWRDLDPIGIAWQDMPAFTWGEMSQITYFTD